jgi:hypothetical protein
MKRMMAMARRAAMPPTTPPMMVVVSGPEDLASPLPSFCSSSLGSEDGDSDSCASVAEGWVVEEVGSEVPGLVLLGSSFSPGFFS